jgi:predicted PurR-regulated permease PerM
MVNCGALKAEISEPSGETTMASINLSPVERSLLVIALILIIVIAVKTISYIVSMFLMAIILTMLVIPALFWLKKKGLSDLAATMLITLAACLIVLGLIGLTALSVNTLITDLPQYQNELNTRVADTSALLAPYGLSSVVSEPPSFDLGQVFSMGIIGLPGIAEAMTFLFFVALLSFFMLLGAPGAGARLEDHLGKESMAIQNLIRMIRYFIDFLVVRTETNFIHGLLFGGFLALIGVHGAILWGVLTFLLTYIPYIGLFIAAVPAIVFAWLQFGVPGAVAVIAAICVLNFIVEHPVLSYLTACKFEMPVMIALISVIFWGWLLGFVGILFAVPITLIVMLIIQSSDELRWINEALGTAHLFKEGNQEHREK